MNNDGVRRHGEPPKVCKRQVCENTVGKKSTYCSADCRQQDKVELWLAGEDSGMWKYDLADPIKDFVIKRAGGRCEAIDSRTGERCKEDRIKSNGRTVCQVDHIDGNWQNSRPDNLRLLCPTCHSLTETWGSGNMGKGRTWKKNYNQFAPKENIV